ncbi:hypothetical protein NB694_004395 [Pantoea ananatis]|uniref:hypothetical protein n=1 Tax=Pantoea ananas TaxID=553 RepID=UPI0021F708DE|nr:hypothetical protein [Pantoea ananatis]MCW0314595.1 hypothetical protein [Pantoea ananatis]
MKSLDKVKWNRVKTSVPFLDIVAYLKKNPYVEDKGYGFDFFEVEGMRTDASYIEKTLRIETVISPTGEEIQQIYVGYESIRFSLRVISKSFFLLAVYNPPKTIKKLTDRLSKDFNYNLGFGSISMNLTNYVDYLINSDDIHLLQIDKVKASEIVLNSSSKASVEITSKKNALNELSEIFNSKSYSIDKIRLTCSINGVVSFVEVSKTAFINSDSNHLNFYSEFLIQQLTKDEP